MHRVLSQHGNVIAADFGNRNALLTISQQILYHDGQVCLFRVTYAMPGKPDIVQHVTLDLNN